MFLFGPLGSNNIDTVLKKKWVKALRSKKFIQRTRSLSDRSYGTFCCLGVLCEVAEIEKGGDGTYKSGTGYVEGCLSDTLLEQFEIDADSHSKLINMNDDEGLSFSDIADWVDANL